MENKYISVQELATQLNISTQAIYKKMKNEFKPYVKLIKGRKMLDISVFAAIDKKNFKPKLNQVDNLVDNQVESLTRENAALTAEIQGLRLLNQSLNDTINILKQECENKQKSIDSLNLLLNQQQQLNLLAAKPSKSLFKRLFGFKGHDGD